MGTVVHVSGTTLVECVKLLLTHVIVIPCIATMEVLALVGLAQVHSVVSVQVLCTEINVITITMSVRLMLVCAKMEDNVKTLSVDISVYVVSSQLENTVKLLFHRTVSPIHVRMEEGAQQT